MNAIYKSICMVLVILLLSMVVILFAYRIKLDKVEKKVVTLEQSLSEKTQMIENLERRIKTNVAADKLKTEMQEKLDKSDWLDKAGTVPFDADILNQLRRTPSPL